MTLVTGVMVCGKSPERLPFAEAAVRSFAAQTWPEKELLIVTDDLNTAAHFWNKPCGVETRVVRTGGVRSLGELRNEGLLNARGEYVIQWDDDDWSHPSRISAQMAFAKPGRAVVLYRQVRYSFENDTAFVYRQSRSGQGIHGTVLHHHRPGLKYEPIGKHEDSHFLDTEFRGNLHVMNAVPELYLRFFRSGLNTWGARHSMGPYVNKPRGTWDLPESTAKYLKEVLAKEYGPA